MVVAACCRIIVAERLGWRRHGNPADLRLVYGFADAMNKSWPGGDPSVSRNERDSIRLKFGWPGGMT